MQKAKLIGKLIGKVIKYAPIIYALIEAAKLVQDKWEELETENKK